MQITINDHRKIFALKQEFNKAFPNFTLEFFEKPSKAGSAPSKKIVKEPGRTLGQCRAIHNKGLLTVNAGMTVADIERDFDDVYGLSVEVLQKAGGAWNKATADLPLN